MSKVAIEGNASGSGTLTIAAPNTNSNFTLSLPTNTGTIITQNSTPAFASTIGVGGATAAASGAGITFPATQSASTNANTLDDYEEGTFTPTYLGETTAGTTTYTRQIGRYTKIGRLVYVMISINITNATGTGNAIIGGLPFATENESSVPSTGSILVGDMTFPANTRWVVPTPAQNVTTVRLFSCLDAATFTRVQVDTSFDMYINLVYQAST
jgi:hypothetical protein